MEGVTQGEARSPETRSNTEQPMSRREARRKAHFPRPPRGAPRNNSMGMPPEACRKPALFQTAFLRASDQDCMWGGDSWEELAEQTARSPPATNMDQSKLSNSFPVPAHAVVQGYVVTRECEQGCCLRQGSGAALLFLFLRSMRALFEVRAAMSPRRVLHPRHLRTKSPRCTFGSIWTRGWAAQGQSARLDTRIKTVPPQVETHSSLSPPLMLLPSP